jgi:hypothetical protein
MSKKPKPLPNRAGIKYGYTAVFPIRDAAAGSILRLHLGDLSQNPDGSPFAVATIIHLLRFIIIDRLPFEGYPAKQESLRAPYLVVMCDFDGKAVEDLARALARHAGGPVCDVWRHCAAFPFATPAELGHADAADRLAEYLRRGQIETVLYLSDQPGPTVTQILRSIQAQLAFATFVERSQTADPRGLKKDFFSLWDGLAKKPDPHPGSL